MKKKMENINVGLENATDFAVINVNLAEYDSNAKIVVERGCIATALIGDETHQLRANNSVSVAAILPKKKGFFQKPVLTCQIIVCKEKIVGHWGVSGIPYCDEKGVTGTCGYYGEITYRLRDAAKAKQEIDGLSDESIGVNIVDALNRRHLERILKRELEKYQWDKNEQRLCDAVKKAYQNECAGLQMSIEIDDISFGNLNEPAVGEDYTDKVAERKEEERRREERINAERAKKEEEKKHEEAKASVWTCPRCKTVWNNDGNYCLKCGTERK